LRWRIAAVLVLAAAATAIVVQNVLAVDTRGAAVRHTTIKSRFAHASLRVTLVQPPGATEGRPLLVFLHGRGDNGEDSNVNDAFFKALAAQSARAPAVVLTARGASDDAHDFAHHDVIGAARRHRNLFAGTPVWLDAGSADPFQPGDRALDRALRSVRLRTYPGAHEGGYWRAHNGAYLRFYAAALASC
jgi:enterochelin esterase-like enzyme